MLAPAQSPHRQTLIDNLINEIKEYAEDTKLQFYNASVRVLLSWLEFDPEEVQFIDNRDHGVDAWYIADHAKSTDSGIDLFQLKTHDLTPDGFLNQQPFDHSGVGDLSRAKTLLLHGSGNESIRNEKLKDLLAHWSYALRSRKLEGANDVLPVTLNLVILGDSLTPQAQKEFELFQKDIETPFNVDNVTVQFYARLYTVDDIINTKWREKNRDWKDLSGKKHDSIHLTPLGGNFISDNKNAVFYCSAIALVNAYHTLGYQLFEPNVRANIKKSRVNQAIRDSVKHKKTRKDFRFLNNGVTITCKSYQKPTPQRQTFNVSHPGVVNGLQTVVALHSAYHELSADERTDFEDNCFVLVRLLNAQAVDNITDVVRATNNQNPMKPRNLVSNSEEQIGFIRFFAEELGWFYEAKEGAWEAFDKDSTRWRPPLTKRPSEFRSGNRKRSAGVTLKKVDNHDLAQSWMSFIGFAQTAVNDRSSLFDNPDHYKLIFNCRTMRHGYDYSFSSREALDEAEKSSPEPNLMLAAHLMYEFAQYITPSAQQNLKSTCERLGIEPGKLSKAELDVKLNQDSTYILHQALRSMSFLFTEFGGFILYNALKNNVHRCGNQVLSNHSFKIMASDFDRDAVNERIDSDNFSDRDLLIILWLMFVDKIEDLLDGEWGSSYRVAPNRPRFVLSPGARRQLYKGILETDEFMKKRVLQKRWATGVQNNQGLFDFIRSCIVE